MAVRMRSRIWGSNVTANKKILKRGWNRAIATEHLCKTRVEFAILW